MRPPPEYERWHINGRKIEVKLLDLVRTANRNLSRSKLRTFLTISAIFVGAFTLTLTTALGAGAQQYLDRQLGNVTAPGVFYVSPKAESVSVHQKSKSTIPISKPPPTSLSQRCRMLISTNSRLLTASRALSHITVLVVVISPEAEMLRSTSRAV
jgi:ABC-type antimicrobial peptide transport system permease subunit